jgi:hypothetical protein|tara:strand:+ start:1207 stop:1398 length:192 start_codon:yes stop_codon:yes gene_type:complete
MFLSFPPGRPYMNLYEKDTWQKDRHSKKEKTSAVTKGFLPVLFIQIPIGTEGKPSLAFKTKTK